MRRGGRKVRRKCKYFSQLIIDKKSQTEISLSLVPKSQGILQKRGRQIVGDRQLGNLL